MLVRYYGKINLQFFITKSPSEMTSDDRILFVIMR